MNKKELFRKYAGESIKNSHAAIKNCWMILFTGGTVALLYSFDKLTTCIISDSSNASLCWDLHLDSSPWTLIHWYYFFLYLSLFGVYILTFYRFYVGNVRVFDVRYDEVFKFIANLCDKKIHPGMDGPTEDTQYQRLFEYSDVWIKQESIFLILQTLLVVFLAVLVLHPIKFIATYLTILCLDIVWILWNGAKAQSLQTYFSNKFFETFDELRPYEKSVRKMFPSAAMKFWRWNNIAFTVMLFPLTVVILYVDGRLFFFETPELPGYFLNTLFVIGVVTMWANCVIDLFGTWTFYNPQFNKNHQRVVDAANRSQPTN